MLPEELTDLLAAEKKEKKPLSSRNSHNGSQNGSRADRSQNRSPYTTESEPGNDALSLDVIMSNFDIMIKRSNNTL